MVILNKIYIRIQTVRDIKKKRVRRVIELMVYFRQKNNTETQKRMEASYWRRCKLE